MSTPCRSIATLRPGLTERHGQRPKSESLGLDTRVSLIRPVGSSTTPWTPIRIDSDAVQRLRRGLYDGIVACISTDEDLSLKTPTERCNEQHGSMFVQRRALERWVELWAEDLIQTGQLILWRSRYRAV